MFSKNTNPNKQGDIGMGLCISYFTVRTNTVCIPLTDSQDYDLVAEMNGLNKISIKTATQIKPSGGYEVDLRTCGGNYNGKIKHFDNNSCDFVFVACADGRLFLIPSKKITNKSGITVGGKSFNEFEVFIGK